MVAWCMGRLAVQRTLSTPTSMNSMWNVSDDHSIFANWIVGCQKTIHIQVGEFEIATGRLDVITGEC